MHLPDIDLMHPRNQIVLIISRIYHNVIPRAKYTGTNAASEIRPFGSC